VSGNLMFEKLTKSRCVENLDDFIAVSCDVSNWGEEQFLSDLPGKWDLSLSVWDDKPIAYTILSKKWSDRIHIHQFMVKAEYRSSGIGSLMLDGILKKYLGEDVSLKVNKDNEKAIKFYERHGFVLVGDSGDYKWMFFRR
jgi:ribosomal protein S18 acetylase RimI-like enzyme